MILKHAQEVCSAGKFADGVTEIPFEFPVRAVAGQELLESYHGVYASILYMLSVTCERGVMKKDLRKDIEFLIEIPQNNSSAAQEASPVQFNISPDSLENVSAQVLATIPKFRISGKMHKTKCPVNLPLTGAVDTHSHRCSCLCSEVLLLLASSNTMRSLSCDVKLQCFYITHDSIHPPARAVSVIYSAD